MSLKNIKLKNRDGFTIVELLIVVVVIAILAAITIVSYNGITNKANASSAKSAASSVQKKIELFAADQSRYPITRAELQTADKPYTLSSSSFGNSAPTASVEATKGTKYVRVQACRSDSVALSASNVTGSRITYWDYEKAAGSELVTLDVGVCAATPNLADLG